MGNDMQSKPRSLRLQKKVSSREYATTALVSGLIGLFTLSIFLGPIAVASGIAALIKGEKERLATKYKAFAIIGIVAGLIGIGAAVINFTQIRQDPLF